MSVTVKALVLKEKVTPKKKVNPGLSDSASLLSDPGCQVLIVEGLNDILLSALFLGVQECFRKFWSYFQHKFGEMWQLIQIQLSW